MQHTQECNNGKTSRVDIIGTDRRRWKDNIKRDLGDVLLSIKM
jgi:hypothetical protein